MKYTMSKKELGRLAMVQGAVDGAYTVKEAALRLHVSERQVKRLKKRFREQGGQAVIHGNSGRHPANYRDDELRARITALRKSAAYTDTNFTRFRELPAENENIVISCTALANLLKAAGIQSKRKHRTEGKRFRRRERRSKTGETLQADAAPFDWFGTGKRSALHGFIDDAAGTITGLYFCENECLMGYLEVMRQTLAAHGVPLELYADKAGIFFVNNKKPENWTVQEMLAGKPLDKTQFGTIVEDRLGITMIPARTPQAKGRIERLWNTLQDRLPVWFKLKGITTLQAANKALPRFIAGYNRRFAIPPLSPESAFVPLGPDHDPGKLLAVRYERTTGNCGCFSFHNFLFQINSKKPLAKKKITFLFSQRTGFQALYDKTYYPVSFLRTPKNGGAAELPEVTRILLQNCYFADAKLNPLAA